MTGAQCEIIKTLQTLYPVPQPELHFQTPFQLLVATMLAAQCTDKQVNKVTDVLFPLFPDAAAMAALDVETLRPFVSSCGFRSKADNLVAMSRILMAAYGGVVPDTREALVQLPGVGRKTANVVLANAFSQPVMAVDTHVFRLSNRMGLANAKNVRQCEDQLVALLQPSEINWVHHCLIFHGRRVCHAKKPDCTGCAVRPWCPSRL